MYEISSTKPYFQIFYIPRGSWDILGFVSKYRHRRFSNNYLQMTLRTNMSGSKKLFLKDLVNEAPLLALRIFLSILQAQYVYKNTP